MSDDLKQLTEELEQITTAVEHKESELREIGREYADLYRQQTELKSAIDTPKKSKPLLK